MGNGWIPWMSPSFRGWQKAPPRELREMARVEPASRRTSISAPTRPGPRGRPARGDPVLAGCGFSGPAPARFLEGRFRRWGVLAARIRERDFAAGCRLRQGRAGPNRCPGPSQEPGQSGIRRTGADVERGTTFGESVGIKDLCHVQRYAIVLNYQGGTHHVERRDAVFDHRLAGRARMRPVRDQASTSRASTTIRASARSGSFRPRRANRSVAVEGGSTARAVPIFRSITPTTMSSEFEMAKVPSANATYAVGGVVGSCRKLSDGVGDLAPLTARPPPRSHRCSSGGCSPDRSVA